MGFSVAQYSSLAALSGSKRTVNRFVVRGPKGAMLLSIRRKQYINLLFFDTIKVPLIVL